MRAFTVCVALLLVWSSTSAADSTRPSENSTAKRRSDRTSSGNSGEQGLSQKERAAQLAPYLRALATLQRSKKPVDLAGAAQTLREGFPDSRPVLHEAAKSSSSLARSFAIRVLGDVGEEREDLDLVLAGLRHSSPKVRLASIMAVRRIGRQEIAQNEAFRAVFEHLKVEKVRNVRKMGVETLEFWPSKLDAVRCLVSLLRIERDKKVRKFVCDSLRTITGQRVPDDTDAWMLAATKWIERQESSKVLQHLEGARGTK